MRLPWAHPARGCPVGGRKTRPLSVLTSRAGAVARSAVLGVGPALRDLAFQNPRVPLWVSAAV